jgi:hypothetical protein
VLLIERILDGCVTAGNGSQNVDAAEFPNRSIDRSIDRCRIEHIALERADPPARCIQFTSRGLCSITVDVEHGDPRPVVQQILHGCTSDAVGAPSNNGNSVGESHD